MCEMQNDICQTQIQAADYMYYLAPLVMLLI